jgi:holliday junction DNA helicase RuvA
MIAYLEGRFVYKSPAVVHMDVNGVGYELQVSLNTYSSILDLDSGVLRTYLHIREESHTLFGFYEQAEKDVFLQLITVSGVGATTARMMLSYMKPEELAKAIVSGDSRTLEGIKGIGRKTAERLVLELRDKMGKIPAESNISPMKNNTLHTDALNALLALGVARNPAEQVIQKVMQSDSSLTSLEDIIKKALKTL